MADKQQQQQTRRRVVCLTVVLSLFGAFAATHSFAQQSNSPVSNQGRQLTLREQLVTGLRAFTKSDLAFINKVVILVEKGKIPRRMVDGTFLWARDRAARRSYTRRLRPMVYFKPAMLARAKRLGMLL